MARRGAARHSWQAWHGWAGLGMAGHDMAGGDRHGGAGYGGARRGRHGKALAKIIFQKCFTSQ